MKVISVVIPTLNEEKYLPSCFDAIENQSLPRDKFEIIIVDGGSTDKTISIAKGHADKIIRGKNPIGAARQAGLKAARTQLVAFTDADSMPKPNWLKMGLEFFKDPKVVGGYGLFEFDNNNLPLELYAHSFRQIIRLGAVLDVYIPMGYNFFMRRDVALMAGGFREDFSIIEEWEFARRMKKYGVIKFNPHIKVRTSARRFASWKGLIPYLQALPHFLIKKTTKDVYLTPIR